MKIFLATSLIPLIIWKPSSSGCTATIPQQTPSYYTILASKNESEGRVDSIENGIGQCEILHTYEPIICVLISHRITNTCTINLHSMHKPHWSTQRGVNKAYNLEGELNHLLFG